jgi:hypothetical protein
MMRGSSSPSTTFAQGVVWGWCEDVIEDIPWRVGVIEFSKSDLDLTGLGDVGGVNWVVIFSDEGWCG